jgi:methyl-accepting chemotaxis protein
VLGWSKQLANTPIVLRLFFAFAWATVIPTIVILILSNTYLQTLRTGGHAVQVSNQAINITTNELAHLQSMHALLVALLPSITTTNTGDANSFQKEQEIILQVLNIEGNFDLNTVSYQDQFQLATSDTMADVRTILLNNDARTTILSRQQTLLDTILEHQWPQYKAAQDDILLGLNARTTLQEAANLLQKADQLYTPLLHSWQQVVEIALQVNSEVVKVGPSQLNPILYGTIAAVVFTMLIVFGISYFVNRTITRPLHRLVMLTRRISSGEISARADLPGNDEIARVAASMNTMLDHIVDLVQQTEERRDTLHAQVEKLIEETRSVGEGDLSLRVQVTTDALGMLARSFNYMIEQLSGLVVGVKQVARDVEHSTAEMLEQTTELVNVGDQQIQQIVETTTHVERMAQASQEVAGHARSLYYLANQSHQSVEGGRLAVLQAVEEVGNIHTSVQATAQKVQVLGKISEEINNVVTVIASIAYQTNRLALDSAIQAAIAGQYGKGFRVVATNIRALAEQTKNQATMIARIVRSVREDIAATALSMQNTAYEAAQEARATRAIEEALNEIFTVVERQLGAAADINQLATQQLQAATKIVNTMHNVSDTTQQNTIHTNNASRLMQHLEQLVEQLRSSVEVFKLREEQINSRTAGLRIRQIGREQSQGGI